MLYYISVGREKYILLLKKLRFFGAFFVALFARSAFFYGRTKMKKVKEVIGLETVEKEKSVTVEQDDSYSSLARHAGMQTVKTSMRGILRSNENGLQRKKLLGE